MDANERANLLSHVDFLKGCTERQVAEIARLVSSRDLAAGDVLCRQGDHESDVFALVDGEAKVEIDGKRSLPSWAARSLEISMERDGHRTATLTALTPLRVPVLDPS